MTAVFLVGTAVAIGLIAWLAVRGAERFLERRSTSALFEVDEAVEFVARALPDDVSSQLSYEDVEALLGWHLVHLAGRGGGVDIADEDAVADLVRRAEADGRDITAAQVRSVLAAEVAYLEAVGAVGAPGEP